MQGRNAKKSLKKVSIVSFIIVSITLSLNADPIQIPFKSHDHLIVAQGSINGLQNLNVVIDTGATYTMISKQLCKRLHIKTGNVSIVSWGKKISVKTGLLREVTIGNTAFKDVQTRVGDLRIAKGLQVDALIGLDLLKRTNLAIDFENQFLTFGLSQDLSQQASFYPNLPYIPIGLTVQGRLLTLILDTGAPRLIFFGEEIEDRIDFIRTAKRERIGHVAGNVKLRKILINETSLAGTHLKRITAFLMNSSGALYGGADGIFSPTSLKLKQLRINFQTNRVSWEL